MSGSSMLYSPVSEEATAQLLGSTFESMRLPPVQKRASTQLESGNPNGIRPELKYISSNLIHDHKIIL